MSIKKCPECGGQIQATRVQFMSGVGFNKDGSISWPHRRSTDARDLADVEDFYCENRHDLNHLSGHGSHLFLSKPEDAGKTVGDHLRRIRWWLEEAPTMVNKILGEGQ